MARHACGDGRHPFEKPPGRHVDDMSSPRRRLENTEVNHKMMLTLTASTMYWSLQQGAEELDMCPSPSDTATTSPNASPAPSISGEDYSYFSGEVSNITFDDGGMLDDASSETVVSSRPRNQEYTSFLHHEVSPSSTGDSSLNNVTTSSRGANVSVNGEGSSLTFNDESSLDSDIEVTSFSPSEVARKAKPASNNGNGSAAGCDTDEAEVSPHIERKS